MELIRSPLYSCHTFLYPFRITAADDGGNRSAEKVLSPDPALWEADSPETSDEAKNRKNSSARERTLSELSKELLSGINAEEICRLAEPFDPYIEQTKHQNSYRYFLPATRQVLYPKTDLKAKQKKESDCYIACYHWKNPDAYRMEILEAAIRHAQEACKELNPLPEETLAMYNVRLKEVARACIPDYERCSKYYIHAKDKTYVLRLTGMSLRHSEKFQTGVLRFETMYFGETEQDGKLCLSDSLFTDVKVINDLGRRVYSPCYDVTDPDGVVITAKKLEFRIRQGSDSDAYTSYRISFPTPRLSMGIEAIRQMMWGVRTEAYNGIKLEGILDERMFTMSIVCDKASSEDAASWSEYQIKGNRNYYEYAFMDQDGKCSCQDSTMLRELVSGRCYSRWKDDGTVFWVTEYSFVCITGDAGAVRLSVLNPFLTMYSEMVQLALIQRTVMEALKAEAERKASRIESLDDNEFKDLWKKFTFFENTLFQREVTFQQQGIELYDLLKNALRIIEIKEHLNDEITQLREYAEMEKADKQSAVAEAFTDIALISTASTLLAAGSAAGEKWASIAISGIGGLVMLYLLIKIIISLTGVPDWKAQKFWRMKEFWRLLIYIAIIIAVIIINIPAFFPGTPT